MQDRRPGSPDGIAVCPFLALADHRDARAEVPDRRHRCYAEPEPAARAIAHQAEYCLTASFAVCPTFQDWARREAARVRPADAPSRARATDAVGAGDAPVVGLPGGGDAAGPSVPASPAPTGHASAGTAAASSPAPAPERGLWSDERAWAAPPPWADAPGTRDERQAGDDADRPAGAARPASIDEDRDEPREYGSGRDPEDRATQDRASRDRSARDVDARDGDAVDRQDAWGEAALRGVTLDPIPTEPTASRPSSTRRPFEEPWEAEGSEPPAFLANRRTSPATGRRDVAMGSRDDAARPPGDRQPDSPSSRPRPAREPGTPGPGDEPWLTTAPVEREPGPARVSASARAGSGRTSPDVRPDGTPRPGRAARAGRGAPTASPGEPSGDQATRPALPGVKLPGSVRLPAAPKLPDIGGLRRGPARSREGIVPGGAPAWEEPLRHEAYPQLRTRVGLPQVPRLWLGAAALVVAALALFLLPTLIPGLFGGQPAATPTPVVATLAPTASLAPTPPPLPTPTTYTVVAGDTLSGIASRYGLTISQLMKANPQIKNENQLSIGEQLTIPVKPSLAGGGGAAPSSALPGGSAAP